LANSAIHQGFRSSGSIDVHFVRLPDTVNINPILHMLDDVEANRANGRTGAERCQFVAGRLALRSVLAAYLQVSAAEVVFIRTSNAAPRAASARSGHRLTFSFSGTTGHVAVAVASVGCVGVDVEQPSAARFSDEVASAMLCDEERTVYASIADSDRTRWLASTWVAKEAVLKALGTGLVVDPAELNAGVAPDTERPTEGQWRRLVRPGDWWVWDRSWSDACLAVAANDGDARVQLLERPFSEVCRL